MLKQPFGTLIADKDVTKQRVAKSLHGATKVISVGDATTERLLIFGIVPDVAVIDGREQRSKRSYPDNYQAKQLRCKNPSGTISEEAVDVLHDALKSQPPVRVVVEGEEDMLALPLFVMAPEGASVLYGQPLEGMVIVKITASKRQEAKELIYRICDNEGVVAKVNNLTRE